MTLAATCACCGHTPYWYCTLTPFLDAQARKAKEKEQALEDLLDAEVGTPMANELKRATAERAINQMSQEQAAAADAANALSRKANAVRGFDYSARNCELLYACVMLILMPIGLGEVCPTKRPYPEDV
eukprot:COSAG05_NODE_1942_length_3800_cov_1.897595_3_plen_128_part_00